MTTEIAVIRTRQSLITIELSHDLFNDDLDRLTSLLPCSIFTSSFSLIELDPQSILSQYNEEADESDDTENQINDRNDNQNENGNYDYPRAANASLELLSQLHND